jgi:hypothetical protein
MDSHHRGGLRPARRALRRWLLVSLALAAACAERADEPRLADGQEAAGRTTTTDATTTTEATSTTDEPAETTTPTTGRHQFTVGERVETSSGDFVQVFTYEQPVAPPDEFTTPEAGNEWAVIDVEACAGPFDDPEGLRYANPFDFELIMPDNTRVISDLPVREPALNDTELPYANDCVRGFVSYQVPAGQRPRAVEDTGTDPSVQWTIP